MGRRGSRELFSLSPSADSPHRPYHGINRHLQRICFSYCYEMTFVKWGKTCQKAKIFQGHLERAKTTENRH